MNIKLNNFIFFAIGATAGSLITWKLVKDKYEQFAKEEIEAVRDVYRDSKRGSKEEDISEEEHDNLEEEVDEYEESDEKYGKIINTNNYTYTDEEESTEPIGDIEIHDGPYIIEPGEWGMNNDHDMICLRVFANGVLTDDWEIPVEDPDDMVGPDIIEEILKDPELDVLYVRNDERKEDYEIIKEYIEYEEEQENE